MLKPENKYLKIFTMIMVGKLKTQLLEMIGKILKI